MVLPKDPKDGVEADKEGREVVAKVEAKVDVQPQGLDADVSKIVVVTSTASMIETGKYSKSEVLSGITSLLEDPIADETDRPIISAAVEFAKNPSDQLKDIQVHTTRIGEVCGMTYDMQGEDIPPALDALHAHLFVLQCVSGIRLVEDMMMKMGVGERFLGHSVDLVVLAERWDNKLDAEELFAKVKDWAITLSKGYKDDTMLNQVSELEARMKALGK